MCLLACSSGGSNTGTAAGGNSSSNTDADSGTPSGTGGSGTVGSGSGNAGASGSPAGGSGNVAGASNAGGSSSTAPDIDALLEEVELACETDCVAIQDSGCPPANINRPTCELQCVVQTNYLGEFCLSEYANLISCRGAGGYACVNDNPVAESNCPSEQSTFSMCTVDLGCKRYCAAARDNGCGGDSLAGCIDDCIAGRDDYPMGCRYAYDGLRQCQGQSPEGCVDGALQAAQQCDYSVVSLAECIADDSEDLCAGWCFAAEQLGCPLSDCTTNCAAMMLDETCGTQFTDMVDCGMFFGDVGCVDEQLLGTSICDTEASAYLACQSPTP